VHHGHQMGVIHRDLKPANILVDASGNPKVIDFGVARAVGSDLIQTSVHTQQGQIVGTPSYMSPEQCDGDPLAVDIRSDIYSLGVLLYELLCGRLPLDLEGRSFSQALHIVRKITPRLPSSLNASLRGDVDTIVMKCLSKECDRRYQSAAELTTDIRN